MLRYLVEPCLTLAELLLANWVGSVLNFSIRETACAAIFGPIILIFILALSLPLKGCLAATSHFDENCFVDIHLTHWKICEVVLEYWNIHVEIRCKSEKVLNCI